MRAKIRISNVSRFKIRLLLSRQIFTVSLVCPALDLSVVQYKKVYHLLKMAFLSSNPTRFTRDETGKSKRIESPISTTYQSCLFSN